ncbi:MAG: polysaccharide ABC transporter ATP-binding protein, partial [Terriglobales bacterium]
VKISTSKVSMISHQGGLDSLQTGRENIFNQLSLSGMSRRAINENVDPIIDFSEIAHSIDAPVGSYSLGMRQRLLFSIYARLSPDLFIVDEALNGGDLSFRRKFQMFLNEFIARGGSILLASHDLFAIQTMCSQCILLNQGQVMAIGEPVEVIDQYQKSLVGSDAGSQPIAANHDNSLFIELGAKAPLAAAATTVLVESVQMSDAGPEVLTPGGPATVRIDCLCRETVSPAACTIIIHDINAQRLAMVTTIQPALTEGRHVLHCFVESLPLVPATYYMMVVFTKADNGVVLGTKGYFDKPLPFEITGPVDGLTTLNRFFRSFLHVSASWTSEPVS